MRHFTSFCFLILTTILYGQTDITIAGQITQGPQGDHVVQFNFEGSDPVSFDRMISSGSYSETFSVVDGWTGGSIEIDGCGSSVLGNVEFSADTIDLNFFYAYLIHCEPTVFGCTDPEAVNYNPNANWEDDSCIYLDCDDNVVMVEINAGGGGNGIGWIIRKDDEEVASGDGYSSNNYYIEYVCLEDGCHEVQLEGNYSQGNNSSIQISLNGEALIALSPNSNEPSVYTFGVNEEGCPDPTFLGCTDPDALNYDPEANTDDGSCIYASDCVTEITYFQYELLCQNYAFNAQYPGISATGNWYVDGVLVEQGSSSSYLFVAESVGEHTICYEQDEDDCYNSEFICQTIMVEEECLDGCPDGLTAFTNDTLCSVFARLIPIDTEGTYQFDFGDGTVLITDELSQFHYYDEPGEYEICMTDVDGCDDILFCETVELTCEYTWDCELELTGEVSEENENTINITYAYSEGNVWSRFWDFGDGTTSSLDFPSHFYEGPGPFDLCLTMQIFDENENMCIIEDCIEVSAEIIETGFLGDGGFMVNVVGQGILSDGVQQELENYLIFPNPATDFFQLEASIDVGSKVNVFDPSGKLVKQFNRMDRNQKLFIGDLENGLYLVAPSKGKAQRLIIMK
jgi:hypothetical protein